MDPEELAKTIANRNYQITQLSVQLNDHLSKINQLEQTYRILQNENITLKKKLEKKQNLITQESNDIILIKNKIDKSHTKSWSETFYGLKSWIGNKMPHKHPTNSSTQENYDKK